MPKSDDKNYDDVEELLLDAPRTYKMLNADFRGSLRAILGRKFGQLKHNGKLHFYTAWGRQRVYWHRDKEYYLAITPTEIVCSTLMYMANGNLYCADANVCEKEGRIWEAYSTFVIPSERVLFIA